MQSFANFKIDYLASIAASSGPGQGIKRVECPCWYVQGDLHTLPHAHVCKCCVCSKLNLESVNRQAVNQVKGLGIQAGVLDGQKGCARHSWEQANVYVLMNVGSVVCARSLLNSSVFTRQWKGRRLGCLYLFCMNPLCMC